MSLKISNMKTPKIKRYRLGVSRTFPTKHPRKGYSTYFVEQICNGLDEYSDTGFCDEKGDIIANKKIHTIRANYPLWEKRMAEVKAGRAIIELFCWCGKPYRSPQFVFATLYKDSGCGVQKIYFKYDCIFYPRVSHDKPTLNLEMLAKNDGLSKEDFKAWFKGYDLSKPMVIIHFTSFRY